MPSIPDLPAPDATGAAAPHWKLRRREWRAVVEYTVSRLAQNAMQRWPRGDGHCVLVIPGFLAGPGSTRLLRDSLRRLGYQPHDWGLGPNLGYRAEMREELSVLVRQLRTHSGGRVSVIGWSAGGIYARELARWCPEDVRMVITLGAPFRGNHRASHGWWLWSLLNRGTDATEVVSAAARSEREQPLTVPTTCIYSKTDGVVAWQCCTSLPAPRTENVEVRATHLGYGHNLEALYVIADRLAQPDGRWHPLDKEKR